jgi:hypothetical protein
MVLATSLPSTLREGTEVRNDLFSRGCWTLIDRALLIAPLIVQPVNGGDIEKLSGPLLDLIVMSH